MVMVLGFFILVAILRLLVITEKPLFCAVIYSLVWLLLSLVFGNPLVVVLIATAITFAYTLGYFWVLVRFMGQGFIWWVLLIAGLVLPSMVRYLLVIRA